MITAQEVAKEILGECTGDHSETIGCPWCEMSEQLIEALESYAAEKTEELTRKGESLCQSYGEALIEISDLKAKLKEAEDKLSRLHKIAEQCLDDDKENELSVELNIAGKWMKNFLEGGNFPT